MEYFNEDAFAQIRKNLDSIPKDMTSTINIKELQREIENNMKQEMRRRNSYVK